MNTVMRAYRYFAFPPKDAAALEAFDAAVAKKRTLWRELISIHNEYRAARQALYAADPACAAATEKREIAAAREQLRKGEAYRALTQRRVDGFREAKQKSAADGLHWSDYNAVVFQFDGAVRASQKRGATPYETLSGEAAVNQIMHRTPARLCGMKMLRWLPQSPREARKKRRRGVLSVSVRGPRNPLGEAKLEIEFIAHRPLPPTADIVEIRAIREWTQVVSKSGEVFAKPRWSVAFVAHVPLLPAAPQKACAVVFDWRGADGEDDLQRAAILHDARGAREIAMEYGAADDWAARKALFEKAAALPDDPARLVQAKKYEARLLRRRGDAQRVWAAQIASRYCVVALQKLNLNGKGVKAHTNPSGFRLALKHAVEARGGTLLEYALPREHGSKKLAQALYERACRDSFSHAQTAEKHEEATPCRASA